MLERLGDVKKAMEQLPAGYRITFSLYALEGYDHQEISGILGISESTIVKRWIPDKAFVNSESLVTMEPKCR
jgi:RNA polymerase sigma-70 factor (ECF subfamily)